MFFYQITGKGMPTWNIHQIFSHFFYHYGIFLFKKSISPDNNDAVGGDAAMVCAACYRNCAKRWLRSSLSLSLPLTRHTESTSARTHSLRSGRRKMSCMKM